MSKLNCTGHLNIKTLFIYKIHVCFHWFWYVDKFSNSCSQLMAIRSFCFLTTLVRHFYCLVRHFYIWAACMLCFCILSLSKITFHNEFCLFNLKLILMYSKYVLYTAFHTAISSFWSSTWTICKSSVKWFHSKLVFETLYDTERIKQILRSC